MRRAFALLVALAMVLPACEEPPAPPPPAPPAEPARDLSPAEQALLEKVDPYKNFPTEDMLPVPQDGWTTLELDGDKIDVFRDEFGCPHIFAPSIDAAFRAQGYVITEDRCIQLLGLREGVAGLRSARGGPGGLGNDYSIRQLGYTEEERRAFLDALQPQHKRIMAEYLKGVNAFLKKYVPLMPPLEASEQAAGIVRYMSSPGDVFGGQQFDLYKLLSLVKFLHGEQFMYNMLDDCLPRDVPNSPTTDHSCSMEGVRVEDTESLSRPLHFEPADMARIYKDHSDLISLLKKNGEFVKLGSQSWAVSAERSASGKAMLFSSPLIGFGTPPPGALCHMMAPGLNVSGLAYVGSPGIAMGHNEHVAWGITSGMVVETDIFEEQLNPGNPLQYRYNGQWKDMQVLEMPIPVRQPDGTLKIERYQVHRTVHGPVIWRVPYNNIAYTRNSAFRGHEVESFTAILDMNFARNLQDFEDAVKKIWMSQNFTAADSGGNIGYWLSGRIPIRHPEQDLRLPTPGTGEYDWRGFTVAPELVRCVNPKEGWLGNFNNKPSIKTPGWWPEMMWGQKIHDTLRNNNPIDWDTFVNINRLNGEHYFPGPFLKPYLISLIRERGKDDPRSLQAAEMFEKWPDNNLPGQRCVLIFDEWMLDTMMELLAPDFKGMVKRDMTIENLQLFGLLTFRILCPDKSGIKLKGDYLHGRDKDEVAYRCFTNVLDRLTAAHGPDMTKWPYTPPNMSMGDLPPFPTRNCGGFWMCTELGNPVRAMDLIISGQTAHRKSPHWCDERPLFDA
ncbi:MAG: penicillin acylase family protein, partial [Candidatus Hydrogenedentes bacterium]|nr:penicillin acylase family protein [Candidatus Hydrogenedentota bacterium]